MGLVKSQQRATINATINATGDAGGNTGGAPSPDGPAGRLARLDATDPRERRQAALAAAAHPETATGLCGRLAIEEDRTVREAILSSLMVLRTAPAVEGLLPYLRSEDADLRNGVIEALQAMPRAIGPYMEEILGDSDPDVRIFAVNVLASLPHPQAPQWLVEVLERDAQVNVCAAAVDALMEVGGPEAAEPLRHLATRFPGEPFLAFAIDAALRRIGKA
jgi:HEAT repeat protein